MVGSLPMNTQPQNIPTTPLGRQNDLGRNMAVGQNSIGRGVALGPDHVVVEDVIEAAEGPVLRPNPATSLEIQQLVRAMELSNQLHNQRMQEMTQAFATQKAQMNERFDQLLGQQNGQNGNRVAPNGVPAAGVQAEAQPNIFGVNPPQPNPPAGGNPAPAVNVPPIGNNPYAAVNQFQEFQPYNQFRQQAHQGVGANLAGPYVNQFVEIGGWNNLGGNANLNNSPL
jgi:hypothetical protein